MEYVSGGELYSAVRKRIKNNFEGIVFYMAELSLALAYLHFADIVYRDLKPENLLIDSSGHIKLIDFGLAKFTTKNKTKTLCGTPGYISPEQLAGKGNYLIYYYKI